MLVIHKFNYARLVINSFEQSRLVISSNVDNICVTKLKKIFAWLTLPSHLLNGFWSDYP